MKQSELFPGQGEQIRGKPSKPIYGVLTVGARDGVRIASRSGSGYARLEVSLGDRVTLRLLVDEAGGWLLSSFEGTWAQAQEQGEWKTIEGGEV